MKARPIKSSRLKRKSPVFRQGYRNGYADALNAKPTEGHASLEDWQLYVDQMKDRCAEEYLAGDAEGYRRGYTEGREVGEYKATDLTLAALLVTAIVCAAAGMAVGFWVLRGAL